MTMTITAKRLAIALATSLALNLFLVGFVAARALWGRGAFDGREYHGREHHGGEHHAGEDHADEHHGHFFGPRGLAGDASGGARQAMRRVLEERKDAFRQQRRSLHAARGAVSEAFAAEPFDRAALERALAELRAQTAESQRIMHESLIEVAPELSPEQRARLAKHALGRERGFGKHRR